MMKARGAEVPAPVDVVVADEVSALARANRIRGRGRRARPHPRFRPGQAAKLEIIANAGTIVLERPGRRVRVATVRRRHQAMASGDRALEAFSIAGGGDTLAAIAKFHIADDVGYISTGGGAFLEFLEGRTCPRSRHWARVRDRARSGTAGATLRRACKTRGVSGGCRSDASRDCGVRSSGRAGLLRRIATGVAPRNSRRWRSATVVVGSDAGRDPALRRATRGLQVPRGRDRDWRRSCKTRGVSGGAGATRVAIAAPEFRPRWPICAGSRLASLYASCGAADEV